MLPCFTSAAASHRAYASLYRRNLLCHCSCARPQTVNIKALGADYEASDGERLPLPVKDLGSCDLYPQTLQHNPNGRFVVVCGDGGAATAAQHTSGPCLGRAGASGGAGGCVFA
jgi:hypothetical protein